MGTYDCFESRCSTFFESNPVVGSEGLFVLTSDGSESMCPPQIGGSSRI
jgi:hypothetical protein